jgi:arginase family enzyme
MRAALLHLDDALAGQADLRGLVLAAEGRVVAANDLGPALRLWSRPPALEAIARRVREHLPAASGPRLVFAGSGDFHHVTPCLLARALEAAPVESVTVVHIDNHPDWVRWTGGLHCGSWVGAAARLPGVARVVTLGVCSGDIRRGRAREGDLDLVSEDRLALFAYRAPDGARTLQVRDRSWPTIEALGIAAFVARLLQEIPTEAVYLTLDKDVLRPADAATNWDQGRMSAEELFAILGAVLAHRRVIGADVVGDWSAPAYGGGAVAALLKQGEALLDQPWRAPPAAARAANEAVNLRLLGLFADAA